MHVLYSLDDVAYCPVSTKHSGFYWYWKYTKAKKNKMDAIDETKECPLIKSIYMYKMYVNECCYNMKFM